MNNILIVEDDIALSDGIVKNEITGMQNTVVVIGGTLSLIIGLIGVLICKCDIN